MNDRLAMYRRMSLEIGYIIFRNIFILVNILILAVVILLVYFGDTREGLFLGITLAVNTVMAIGQDINGWVLLERLQLLTTPRVKRLRADGSTDEAMPEQLRPNDRIRLALGDQVPSDCVLEESNNLEVSESMITGESASIPKKASERLLAGSIVTAGTAVARIETLFKESRIAKMTERIKRFTVRESPTQKDINRAIAVSGYVLLGTIAYIVIHGMLTQQGSVDIIRTVGALSSILIPQGLAVAMTLLFAYGGLHFYRRHVLIREANAAEKMAFVKNLCMDKTGTLTTNTLVTEHMHVPEGTSEDKARRLSAAYVGGADDSSQLIQTIRAFLGDGYSGEIRESLPFSSWRQFGAVRIVENGESVVILASTPEVFMPYLADENDSRWLSDNIVHETKNGKRVFCIVQMKSAAIPHELIEKDISVVALFVLENDLRDGVREAVEYFQKRGVRIRILSGDNTETIRSVVARAGVSHADKLITGREMERWTDEDYKTHTKDYTIFARTVPEQKEKIISVLRDDGFTAMIGDGANDALAIKKADLGIAMSEGSPAARMIAAIVLMHNSFIEMPRGVRLADSMIENLRIFGAIFFNQTFIGFFLFILISLAGVAFAFTPLNLTFSNYFTVGFSSTLIWYWAMQTREEPRKQRRSFLGQVIPFALGAGAIEAMAAAGAYLYELPRGGAGQAITLTVMLLILFGMVFLASAPRIYSVVERKHIVGTVVFALCELGIGVAAFAIPGVAHFFDLVTPSAEVIRLAIEVTAVYVVVQYFLTRVFARILG